MVFVVWPRIGFDGEAIAAWLIDLPKTVCSARAPE